MAQQTFQTRMYEIIGELGNYGLIQHCLQIFKISNNCINSTSVKDNGEGVLEYS